jgi:hypothetical protein
VHQPEKYAFKAITLLVEKGSCSCDWSKCGEVAGIKIQTKAIP